MTKVYSDEIKISIFSHSQHDILPRTPLRGDQNMGIFLTAS